jgi:soluble cytochrome b562
MLIMKIRPALAWLVAFPIVSPVVSAADTPAAPPPSTAPAAAPGIEKKTELEMRMGRIGKAFRKLKKQVADPAQNAASLELLSTMETAAKEAIDLTPAKAEDIPEDQRAKFEADFQGGIRNLQDMFTKLRDALAAGKNDDAAKLVDDIGAFEKKEHKEFRRPEKD